MHVNPQIHFIWENVKGAFIKLDFRTFQAKVFLISAIRN